MNDKLILNIGRQIGSGGHIIASMLAEEFDCRLYDREILNLAAKESGFSEKFFEQNDEQKGFLKNVFHMQLPLMSANNFYQSTFSQESLYQFQSDAIRQAVRENKRCVFVGRTADYVLRDEEAINVFITANMEFRIDNVAKRLECNRETARKFIVNKESERAKFYNYYTGKTWGNAENYDLCIDSSQLGLEKTKEFITAFVRMKTENQKTNIST